MHGPVWNDPNVGVTGEEQEKNFKNTKPNYVSVTDAEGTIHTLVGADADEYRRNHPTV